MCVGGRGGRVDVEAMFNGGTRKIFSSGPRTSRSPDLFGWAEGERRGGGEGARVGVGGEEKKGGGGTCVCVCAKRGGGWGGAEDVKIMSNGGTKKRIFSSSPVTCRSPDLFGPKERCGRKEQRMGVGGFGGVWREGQVWGRGQACVLGTEGVGGPQGHVQRWHHPPTPGQVSNLTLFSRGAESG